MKRFNAPLRPVSLLAQSALIGMVMIAATSVNAAAAPYNPSTSMDKKHKSHKGDQQRRRDWREDRRKGYGDWSNTPDLDRHRGRRDRSDRWDRYDRRQNRRNNRHRQGYRHNYFRQNIYHDSYNPYNNYVRHYDSRGYRNDYRSSLGINFIFGNPGYSTRRWANTRYSFYQPGQWSYNSYRNSVQCSRIMVQANHYDHIELISVEQCYTPLDGFYIIQGSERIVDCIMKD